MASQGSHSPAAPAVAPRSTTSPVHAEIELSALAAIVASSMTGDFLSSWKYALLLLWAAGMVVALLPLLLATLRVGILARSARHISGGRWKYLIESTPAISHLSSRVHILESTETSMPMTWGVFHPTLLIPRNESARLKCRTS